MTNRNEMIELAKRRAKINKKVEEKQQLKKRVRKTKGIYMTTREISESKNLTMDAIRYRMRDQKPTKINLHPQSYANGYTMDQINQAFPT